MIIKPILDFIGDYDVATIGILSSATVFSMACVSLLKATREGIRIKGRVSFILAGGSIIGGIVGKIIFNYLVNFMKNDGLITTIQAGILAALMLIIFLLVKNNQRIKTYNLKNIAFILIVGFGLGMLSSFLGIGGGPLNIAILAWLFSMNTRDATINSIFIIFFSQLSSLLIIASTTGYSSFDLSMLSYMLIGGVVGGFIGTSFSQKLTDRKIENIFYFTLTGIFLINIYNMVRYFL